MSTFIAPLAGAARSRELGPVAAQALPAPQTVADVSIAPPSDFAQWFGANAEIISSGLWVLMAVVVLASLYVMFFSGSRR